MPSLKINYVIDKTSNVIRQKMHFERVGIIPFFLHEKQFYFFMMMDAIHKELTDAGGYSRKKEKWIKTASRELYEETRGLFSYSYNNIIDDGIIVYSKDCQIAIIFMFEKNFNPNFGKNLCIYYNLSYMMGISNNDKKEFMENSDMKLIDFNELSELCLKGRQEIYRPVRFLLRSFFKHLIKDFYYLFFEIKCL